MCPVTVTGFGPGLFPDPVYAGVFGVERTYPPTLTFPAGIITLP
jgi:hypothetical protein